MLGYAHFRRASRPQGADLHNRMTIPTRVDALIEPQPHGRRGRDADPRELAVLRIHDDARARRSDRRPLRRRRSTWCPGSHSRQGSARLLEGRSAPHRDFPTRLQILLGDAPARAGIDADRAAPIKPKENPSSTVRRQSHRPHRSYAAVTQHGLRAYYSVRPLAWFLHRSVIVSRLGIWVLYFARVPVEDARGPLEE